MGLCGRCSPAFCRRCNLELDDSYERCPYCCEPLARAPIVDSAPPEPVVVAHSTDRPWLAVAESLLRSAEIPYLRRLHAFGAVEFLVAPGDADDARTLLARPEAGGGDESDI